MPITADRALRERADSIEIILTPPLEGIKGHSK